MQFHMDAHNESVNYSTIEVSYNSCCNLKKKYIQYRRCIIHLKPKSTYFEANGKVEVAYLITTYCISLTFQIEHILSTIEHI